MFFQYGIPELENPASELFQSFIEWLQDQRPHHAPIRVIRYVILYPNKRVIYPVVMSSSFDYMLLISFNENEQNFNSAQ